MTRKSHKDYYKILGVDKEADPDTIKSAYRKKAMKYHPDRNKGDKKSEEMFKEVSAAYEVLSDEDKKARYDRGDEYEVRFDPQDVYSQVFNMAFGFGNQKPRTGRRRTQQRFSQDIKLIFRTTLECIIKGQRVEVKFDKHITCEKCKGGGSTEMETKCSFCDGTGMMSSINGNMYFSMTCGECGGAGKKLEPCKDCDGKGFKTAPEEGNYCRSRRCCSPHCP